MATGFFYLTPFCVGIGVLLPISFHKIFPKWNDNLDFVWGFLFLLGVLGISVLFGKAFGAFGVNAGWFIMIAISGSVIGTLMGGFQHMKPEGKLTRRLS
ncbi:hypothetical protein ACFL2R_04365 [Patescibacteria group bacterium]